MPRTDILMQLEGQNVLRQPRPIRTPPDRRSRRKYCRYHRDHGHFTDDCFELKEEIEALIRQGRLREYVYQPRQQQVLPPPPPGPPPGHRPAPPAGPPLHDIHTIMGGPSSARQSNRARKAYAREAFRPYVQPRPGHHTSFAVSLSPTVTTPLTFTDDDLEGLHIPHDDAIVVTTRIGNHNVHRILIDNASSVDVLFADAFDQLGISRNQLRPVSTPLYGFAGTPVMPAGSIDLPLTAGTSPCQITLMVTFLVVQCPSTYNAIIGRPTLNNLRAVTSTYHLKVKFPTPAGPGVL